MMAQLEHIEAIENRLWSSADNLRANSNYASNEYFLPVMGLIFLRHAYSRYLEGWEKSSIKELGKVITGKTPSTRESDNYGGDTHLLRHLTCIARCLLSPQRLI